MVRKILLVFLTEGLFLAECIHILSNPSYQPETNPDYVCRTFPYCFQTPQGSWTSLTKSSPPSCKDVGPFTYDPNSEDGAVITCRGWEAGQFKQAGGWTITRNDKCQLYCDNDPRPVVSVFCDGEHWQGDPQKGFYCYEKPDHPEPQVTGPVPSAVLAEVEVEDDENEGSYVEVEEMTASSIYGFQNEYGAHLAIDGELSDESRYFLHTKTELYSWAGLKLSQPQMVAGVELFNRVDCCGNRLKNLEIRAGLDPVPEGTTGDLRLTQNERVAFFPGPGADGGNYRVMFATPKLVQFITFQLTDRNSLNLNEVKVIAGGNDAENEGTPTGSIIQSPNFPNNYPNHQDETYNIAVGAGQTIQITFDIFDLEAHDSCVWDWVKIVDKGQGTTLLDKACGRSLPGKIISKSNNVDVMFHSDYSVTKKGFKLQWKASGDPQCSRPYKILSDKWRMVEYGVRHPDLHCDQAGSSPWYTNLEEGWHVFRFDSRYATLPSSPPAEENRQKDQKTCGAAASSWSPSALPTMGQAPQDINIHFALYEYEKYPGYSVTGKVVACPGEDGQNMFLYYLPQVKGCYNGYCAI